jgi:uncharacterized phiE125 gp8 family phage protein
MNVIVKVKPTEYPLTLAEGKVYAKATADTSEDEWIDIFIRGATELLESKTSRTIAQATLELTLNDFKPVIKLPNPPVQSITSIKYDDVNGVEQTLDSSLYVLDNSSLGHANVTPKVNTVWPDTQPGAINSVRVQYVAGFANATLVPSGVKVWVGMHVAFWFENRSAYEEKQMQGQIALNSIKSLFKVYTI